MDLVNRIINADCMDILPQMEDNFVEMTLTDIPYEIREREEHGLRKFNKNYANEITFDLEKFLHEVIRVTKGSIYIFCGFEQVSTIWKTFEDNKLSTRFCTWVKSNPPVANGEHLWLSSTEHAVYGKKSGATFNEFCSPPVWTMPVGSSKEHPTQKPLRLFSHLVRASSNKGDIVLDPCVGSGTTAVAAKQEHRKYIGIELNEEAYNLAKRNINQTQLSLL